MLQELGVLVGLMTKKNFLRVAHHDSPVKHTDSEAAARSETVLFAADSAEQYTGCRFQVLVKIFLFSF